VQHLHVVQAIQFAPDDAVHGLRMYHGVTYMKVREAITKREP
jgi:hypothetical protein